MQWALVGEYLMSSLGDAIGLDPDGGFGATETIVALAGISIGFLIYGTVRVFMLPSAGRR